MRCGFEIMMVMINHNDKHTTSMMLSTILMITCENSKDLNGKYHKGEAGDAAGARPGWRIQIQACPQGDEKKKL